MTGLLFYSLVAAGLGGLLPLSLRSGMGTVGVRFALGYATMVILAYVFHILLSVPLGPMVAILGLLALLGFVLLIYRAGGNLEWWELLVHPALLLIAAGVAAVAINGGIDYLPYSNDEFSHWLRTPRLIHLGGGWAEVVNILHLSYYPPGWNLTLLLPWQLSGSIDLGLSAAAPFVLHITVIALIYDLVGYFLRHRTDMAPLLVKLAAWVFVLLFVAAEGMGRLWTYTLLIEQPQIYSYATVVLLIFAAEAIGQDRKTLYGIAGGVLASAYLYKVAAIAFVPAVIGLAGIAMLMRAKGASGLIRENLVSIMLLAGPILIAAASWSMAIDAKACSPLTLSADQWATAMALDWRDLAGRFGMAVWTYVGTYKLPVTLAAGLGVVGAVVYGNFRAALVMLVLTVVYFLALYATHLVCLGPYYFENLNSIARFTRVPLQMFHAVGLVMLADTLLRIVETRKLTVQGGVFQRWSQPWISGSLILLIVVLGGWQGRQIYRSVVDTTTRAYQSIDTRIGEMHRANGQIDQWRGSTLPAKPVLAVVCQNCDNVPIAYARFFALGYQDGRLDPRYTVLNQISWAPRPVNVWQIKASIDDVVKQLSKADIIWPIKINPWILPAFARLVNDRSCLSALPDRVLLRDTAIGDTVRFRCIGKK